MTMQAGGVAEFNSENAFERACLSAGRPALLRGAIRHWPAVTRWTPEYLIARVGDVTCDVSVSPNAVFGYHAAAPACCRMPFCEAVRQIEHGRSDGAAAYLMQVSLKTTLATLLDDIDVPAVLRGSGIFPYFWFGAPKSVTPIHYDGLNNLFAQVRGRKRFTLFDPQDMDSLYPGDVSSATSHVGQVDVEHPDLDRFPKFRNAKPASVDLAPGDLLYVPAFFWHHVRSRETSISVNFWWAPTIEQCLVPAFLRDLRTCYLRDALKSIGSPFADCPGGLLGAARRAMEGQAPEIAVLLLGAAIEKLDSTRRGREERTNSVLGLRLCRDSLADRVSLGASCTLDDAARMLSDALAMIAELDAGP